MTEAAPWSDHIIEPGPDATLATVNRTWVETVQWVMAERDDARADVERLRKRTHELQADCSKRQARLESFEAYWLSVRDQGKAWYDTLPDAGVPADANSWLARSWFYCSQNERERVMVLFDLLNEARAERDDLKQQVYDALVLLGRTQAWSRRWKAEAKQERAISRHYREQVKVYAREVNALLKKLRAERDAAQADARRLALNVARATSHLPPLSVDAFAAWEVEQGGNNA